MRTETTTRTLYTFDELSEQAQEKARDWYRNASADDSFWSECVIDDAKQAAALLGIDIDRAYFSGFWSQGDGACFEGRYKYRKDWKKALAAEYGGATRKALLEIGAELQAAQKPVFYTGTAETYQHYHSACMRITADAAERFSNDARDDFEENITDALRSFADWVYRQLESEYDYQNSAEAIDETIRANEYEFTENGAIA